MTYNPYINTFDKTTLDQNTLDREFRDQGIVDFAPTRARAKQGKELRKRTLVGICLALTAATGFIAATISISSTHAAAQPVFTIANAVSAKHDAGVGSIAAITLMVVAASAYGVFTRRSAHSAKR